MRPIDALLSEYGESHQHPTNKLVHWICVPLIMFSLIGLLWSIPAAWLQDLFHMLPAQYVTWGSLFLLAAALYYLRLSLPIFFGMLVISALLIAGNVVLAQWEPAVHALLSLSIFALAWIGQFWGHKIEGKKPSFLKDLQFLLIGPAWLMHFVFKKMGLRY